MSAQIRTLIVGRSVASVDMPAGMVTDIAANNLEAVRFLQSTDTPNAVVCEYHLPGKNGFFLLDWMRSKKEFEQVPFILVSSRFEKELRQMALEKKADDYLVLQKVSPDGLQERLEFLCDFRRRSRSAKGTTADVAVYRMPLSKRIFDVTVALGALIVLSPILLLTMLAIRLESKGKVFFTSKRVGRKVFDFYKLRSMRTDAEHLLAKLAKENNLYNATRKEAEVSFTDSCPRCSLWLGNECTSPAMYDDKGKVCDFWFNQQRIKKANAKSAFVKIANDPRVTRVGKFIRNTSIDELPQLINVLKGDMSIVGNRPLPLYEAEMLTADSMSKRFLAPAGLTGLWQVELRGRKGNMSEEERKDLDNQYADHFYNGTYSFWYDMNLILRTIPALFQKSSV